MVDVPERIWAASVTENYGEWQTTTDGLPRPTEYTRSDLVAELEAEVERLRSILEDRESLIDVLSDNLKDYRDEALSRTDAVKVLPRPDAVSMTCGTICLEYEDRDRRDAAYDWLENRAYAPLSALEPAEVGGLVERLRETHTCDGCGEYVGSQVTALLDEAATALTTERAAHAETKRERDTWRDNFSAMHQQTMTAEARVADLEKALDPFAEIAGELWADENGWTNAACQNDRICDWFGPSAFRTARRVREGGKVDG